MIDFLQITNVQDRGIANKERVAIRVNHFTQLNQFWVSAGIKSSKEAIYPINDNLFWLGRGYVTSGDWIFIYTGFGTPQTVKLPNSVNNIYTFYWGRSNVLFQSPEVFPFLLHTELVGLPEDYSPLALPKSADDTS